MNSPQAQIEFGSIINLHQYLSSLPNPSEAMKEAIAKLETHITTFVNSLQTTATINERPN